MKIGLRSALLVQVHSRDPAQGSEVFAPIGPAYVSAALAAAGWTAPVILSTAHPVDQARLLARIRDDAIRWIGFSATGNELSELGTLARVVKQHHPDLPIVVGGYCSWAPERVFAAGPIDVLVRGEGEATAVETAEALLGDAPLEGVRGLVLAGIDGRLRQTPPRPAVEDLDTLALPSYEHVPSESPILRVYASRGCPFDCTFCRIKDFFGTNRIRFHGEQYIEGLLRNLLRGRSVPAEVVFFNDDEFLLLPDHLRRMAAVIRRLGLRMCFQTRTPDVIHFASVLRHEVQVIDQIHLGVESFSQSQLDRWSKRTTVGQNMKALQVLADMECSYYPYIILTDAHTTVRELDETCEGLTSMPACPHRVRVGGSMKKVPMVPLHRGLHLNRMKSFDGRVEKSPRTWALDPLWEFLAKTEGRARMLSRLCRHGAASSGRGGTALASFSEGTRLLDDRILSLPALFSKLSRLSRLDARLMSEEAALRFNHEADRAAAFYMARFASGLAQAELQLA